MAHRYFALLLFCYCLAQEPIEVYFVCHSHTDAGWIQTYDIYFDRVEYILESVVDTLGKYEDFKFNWADTNFLSRWYDI